MHKGSLITTINDNYTDEPLSSGHLGDRFNGHCGDVAIELSVLQPQEILLISILGFPLGLNWESILFYLGNLYTQTCKNRDPGKTP